MIFRKHEAFTLFEILVALSIIAVIFTSASVLDYSYILKKNARHLSMDLSSRILTAVAEQAINPQNSVLTVELPSSCSGEKIEIGAGGHVLNSSEIICNGSSFWVSTSGQVYEKK
jgi:prepilin-type N-terminal cleavage/methylation domain-containing protein